MSNVVKLQLVANVGRPVVVPRSVPRLRSTATVARTCVTQDEAPDAETVIARLEEAGCTLLSLPGTGYSTRLRSSNLDIVRAAEAFGTESGRMRPPVPSPAQVTRMDEALGWITLIPKDRYVLRRIVGARSLVSPSTEKHLYSWRRLGVVLGADHKAVQRWHASGIDAIVETLTGGVEK